MEGEGEEYELLVGFRRGTARDHHGIDVNWEPLLEISDNVLPPLNAIPTMFDQRQSGQKETLLNLQLMWNSPLPQVQPNFQTFWRAVVD